MARAEKQAKEFIASLIAAKYSAREVTAMADIRGYTLYQQRYYGQAHAWFAQAVHTDPRYELSLFNAARTAALLGRKSEAKSYITALAKLETPLSRARMRLVKEQADFRDVR